MARVAFSVLSLLALQAASCAFAAAEPREPAGGQVAAEIHEIQGSGLRSPFAPTTGNAAGTQVSTRNNIVTAIRAVPGASDNGFFIQTPDAAADGSMATSQGIFVATGSAQPTVAIGDAVDVAGAVREFGQFTQISAPLTVAVLSTGNPMPLAIAFGTGQKLIPSKNPAALSCGATNLECFESMRVQVNDGRVVRSNLRSGVDDPYAEVFVSAYGERGLRERGLRFGGTLTPGDNTAAGVWDGNPDIFELDVDEVGGADAAPGLTAGTRFTATGVIGYSIGDYELYPTEFEVTAAAPAQRPVRAATVRESTIGSLNAFNLCDATSDVGTPGVLFECVETMPPTAAQYDARLSKVANYIGSVLRLPSVIAIQEVEKLSVLTALAARIQALFGVAYAAHLIEGNDPNGEDVGFLTRIDRVTVNGVTRYNATQTWQKPGFGSPRLFDQPPLVLDARLGGRRMLVMAIQLEFAGNSSNDALQRFEQARSVAMLVQSFQAAPATASVPLFVVGDFNAYQFTDGVSDLVGLIAGVYDNAANLDDLAGGNIVAPPLLNAVDTLDPDEQYSFTLTEYFGPIHGHTAGPGSDDGRDVPTPQVRDHALLNVAAQAMLIEAQFARGNVDAPDEAIRLDATGPLGASTHDGIVLFVRNEVIFGSGFE